MGRSKEIGTSIFYSQTFRGAGASHDRQVVPDISLTHFLQIPRSPQAGPAPSHRLSDEHHRSSLRARRVAVDEVDLKATIELVQVEERRE
jgi:hypothetical protein